MRSRPELADRELFGIVTNSRQQLFQKYLPPFKERPKYDFQHSVNVVHIGIDPSGGGAGSAYAIVSLCHEEDRVVILGLDTSTSYLDNEVLDMLTDHVMGLRNHPACSEALFIMYIEANMSFLAVSRLKTFFSNRNFGPVQIASRDPKNQGRDGVWTSHSGSFSFFAGVATLLLLNSICKLTQGVFAVALLFANENRKRSDGAGHGNGAGQRQDSFRPRIRV